MDGIGKNFFMPNVQIYQQLLSSVSSDAGVEQSSEKLHVARKYAMHFYFVSRPQEQHLSQFSVHFFLIYFDL